MKRIQSNRCPLCDAKLQIHRLSCPQCKAEYPLGEELSPFDYLSAEQTDFLMTFLRCKGNFKAVEAALGISYPTVNKRYAELLTALGLQEENKTEKENIIMHPTNRASNLPSYVIWNKLYDCGGTVVIPQQKGDSCRITFSDGGKGFVSDKLQNQTIDFCVFDIIVDFLKQNGGKAPKGIGRGEKDKVGSGKCGPETIIYQIATQYYGKKEGESTFDPLFVLAAVLEWAGIAENGWGYLRLL